MVRVRVEGQTDVCPRAAGARVHAVTTTSTAAATARRARLLRALELLVSGDMLAGDGPVYKVEVDVVGA